MDLAALSVVKQYVLILHMNEAGDKITRLVEFVDSHNSVTFFPKLREYILKL